MSSTTIGSRLAAVRPVIPSPNGTIARPMWWRSMPLVAASVSDGPVAVHEVQRRHLGPERDPGPVHDGLEELLPGLRGGREPEQLVEEPQLGDGVVGRRRIRQVGLGEMPGRRVGAGLRGGIAVIPEHRHVHHTPSLGAAVTELGCGPVPGRCPCSRTVTEERLTGAPCIGILARWHPAPARPSRAEPPRPSRAEPARSRVARFPAVAAEPPGPGLARARDPLRREVRMLGSLLGQVIAEQGGPELFVLVERIRRRMIAARRDDPSAAPETDDDRQRVAAGIGALDLGQLAAVGNAFTIYFQLVNLAEERHRIRTLRTRARRARGRPIDDSIGEAVARLGASLGREGVVALLARMEVHPVLTAHPTEARRRTLLVAQRRIRRLLDAMDDPLTTPDEDADLRRRLREEITLLWHTGDLRAIAPTPLDEVRSELAIFDETLFIAIPRFERAVDRALDALAGKGPNGARGGRCRADRHAARGRSGAASARVVDRVGPGRTPGRDLGRDARGRAPPGGPPPARLRGGREPAHADRRGPRPRVAPRPGPRHRARP